MVSEACCNSDQTQAVFPDPVIPAIMQVKGCSKRNHHHISIVFPPPPPPPPPHFYCFPSTRFYKRLPTAILSSFCSNVSCSEQQSWLSSAVSYLPRLSAPVSFKDSYTTATSCTSPSLIQFTHETHSYPRRK